MPLRTIYIGKRKVSYLWRKNINDFNKINRIRHPKKGTRGKKGGSYPKNYTSKEGRVCNKCGWFKKWIDPITGEESFWRKNSSQLLFKYDSICRSCASLMRTIKRREQKEKDRRKKGVKS